MRNIQVLSFLFICGVALLPAEGKLDSLFPSHNITGSIVVYDMKASKWIYSDKVDANRKTIPASTFKIINALIALEENAIANDDTIRWDGKDKTFRGNSVTPWNADANLESAFKNSTIWFFVELSKRIDRKTYDKYLRMCDYGNFDLSEKGDDFWNYGNMSVSPKNQVEFLAKLYKSDLPFKKQNMDLIKSYMQLDVTESYKLSGKSGWGIKDGKDIGWLIGFLEKGTNTYIYATRIVADSNNVPSNFGKLRSAITLEAFQQLGIIQ